MTAIAWTHPSVVRLLETKITDDPLTWIERRSREVALTAMEQGWTGPPYDSFMLADALGIEVVARQDLDDARLVAIEGRPRIEFNPQRRAARVRFSIAHEIGHWLFDDYAERTRYRDMDQRRADDWQLEVLCNIAAAGIPDASRRFPDQSDRGSQRRKSPRPAFEIRGVNRSVVAPSSPANRTSSSTLCRSPS